MGYTTEFCGQITIAPPLSKEEITFLKKFSETRRMNREKGAYFVDGTGFAGQDNMADIIDFNAPPSEQPSLWCHWAPTDDGMHIGWNGAEKFHDAAEWMWYLIWNFLRPNSIAKMRHPEQFTFLGEHLCNGTIEAQGDTGDDKWNLVVVDNVVSVQRSELVFGEAYPIVNPTLETKYCFEVNKDSIKCNTCSDRFKCYTDEKIPALAHGSFGRKSYW